MRRCSFSLVLFKKREVLGIGAKLPFLHMDLDCMRAIKNLPYHCSNRSTCLIEMQISEIPVRWPKETKYYKGEKKKKMRLDI